MSYLLPHLNSGWAVDQAILAEEERVVVIRFGHDWDPDCMGMDETLFGIAGLYPFASRLQGFLLKMARFWL
jgi:DIM1 family U5 snRNP protein